MQVEYYTGWTAYLASAMRLRGLTSPGSASTPLTSTQSSQQQRSAGSTVMGAALPDDKDISNTVLMHKMSGVKQREHRQKGVS